MNKLILFFVLFLIMAGAAAAAESSGLTFLKIGIDARAAAMGEAYSAV